VGGRVDRETTMVALVSNGGSNLWRRRGRALLEKGGGKKVGNSEGGIEPAKISKRAAVKVERLGEWKLITLTGKERGQLLS